MSLPLNLFRLKFLEQIIELETFPNVVCLSGVRTASQANCGVHITRWASSRMNHNVGTVWAINNQLSAGEAGGRPTLDKDINDLRQPEKWLRIQLNRLHTRQNRLLSALVTHARPHHNRNTHTNTPTHLQDFAMRLIKFDCLAIGNCNLRDCRALRKFILLAKTMCQNDAECRCKLLAIFQRKYYATLFAPISMLCPRRADTHTATHTQRD